MQAYLNEFAFRFNRRRSGHRGLLFHRLLEGAVRTDPVRYRDLVANPRPGWARPAPPPPEAAHGQPASTARTLAGLGAEPEPATATALIWRPH